MLPVAVGLGLLGAVGFRSIVKPAPGDRYEVDYRVDDCGFIYVDVDGMVVRGDLPEGWVPTRGHGTLTLTRVREVSYSDGSGVGVVGSLALDNGPAIAIEGGTKGVAYFTAYCRI